MLPKFPHSVKKPYSTDIILLKQGQVAGDISQRIHKEFSENEMNRMLCMDQFNLNEKVCLDITILSLSWQDIALAFSEEENKLILLKGLVMNLFHH